MVKRFVIAALMVPALALANGRPPMTNGVYFRPGDDQALYVRSTFGLLVSKDGGCSFRWVCEKAIGYGGEFDPKYAVASDGTIFATTFEGLRVSRDGGCTWATATAERAENDPGRIANMWIDTIDIASNGDVWVGTASTSKPNDVYRSTDNGMTFSPAGLSTQTGWWKSVRVAKSDPRRIYATGYQVAPETGAFLRRSTNGGASWSELTIPANVQLGVTPLFLVAAVDPTNPDHLFAIATEANPPRGDRVYRSTDGGTTFTEVLATSEPVRDLVFRSSGTVLIATLASGTYESKPQGAPPFAKIGEARPNLPDATAPHHGCLAERPNGELVGCGANWQPDYMAVGKATSPLAWQKLFRFVELAGPLACAAGTTAATECDPQWPALSQQFGVTGPPAVCGASPDAPPLVDGPPRKTEASGCCETGSTSPGSALLAFGVLALLRRGRRASSGCAASRRAPSSAR